MADNYWIRGYVVRDSLVVLALMDSLVGRHTQAVGHYPGKDFIVTHRRKFELFKPEIGLAVKSDCLCFHAERTF